MNNIRYFKYHSDYVSEESGLTNPNVSYCANQADVHYKVKDYKDEYLTFEALEDGTFSFSLNSIQYSVDSGETWATLTTGNSTPTVAAGETIMWKQTGLTPNINSGIGTFSSSGLFNAMGNIMSLYYGDNFRGELNLSDKPSAFRNLFFGCHTVVSMENLSLPALTLSDSCYRGFLSNGQNNFNDVLLYPPKSIPATNLAPYCCTAMFQGCRKLKKCPELPCENLAHHCYQHMFNYCTSITKAPKLPAKVMAGWCYFSMFQRCENLSMPPELPATTLAERCYQYMFSDCISLTVAPKLPATNLANLCYCGMFWNCAQLIVAPELPSTTLATQCYYSMFNLCKSLTIAPELPATTLATNCYDSMFKGCTNIKRIKAMFTTTPSATYTPNWVDGVSTNGTFVKNDAATWNVTGVHGIPNGWTVETASS